MADVYSFNDMKNKKTKKVTQTVVNKPVSEVPFTGFYFLIGDETVEIGEALFKDILPFLKENVEVIANSHIKRYASNSLTDENVDKLLNSNAGFMNLVSYRQNFGNFASMVVTDLEDFQQVGDMLDTPEGTAVVAALFSTAFYQKYSSFDIATLLEKNWILVSPTYAKYLLKEKDKLDDMYGAVTQDELTRYFEKQLMKLTLGGKI